MAEDKKTDEAKAADVEAKNAQAGTPEVQENTDRDQAVQTPVDAKDEEKRKAAPQDRTGLDDTDHVTHHLDRDPNDPRNAEPTPKLPSLNDPGQS